MTKGTSSMGRRIGETHTLCRRCGRVTFHIQHGECGACGYPSPKKRGYNWGAKAIRRKTTGTGRMALPPHSCTQVQERLPRGHSGTPRKEGRSTWLVNNKLI
eukprot:EC718382.1.p1 GENE.EC718382.1~~EC718382.1.p1  ORF type:complete len:102 (+),score=9.37 EC718382.1:52-357(+)